MQTRLATNAWNPYGLADMYGNISEWCHDSYTTSLMTTPDTNPVYENTLDDRVIRGGSWQDFPKLMRSASRESEIPTTSRNKYGIRIVRSLPQ